MRTYIILTCAVICLQCVNSAKKKPGIKNEWSANLEGFAKGLPVWLPGSKLEKLNAEKAKALLKEATASKKKGAGDGYITPKPVRNTTSVPTTKARTLAPHWPPPTLQAFWPTLAPIWGYPKTEGPFLGLSQILQLESAPTQPSSADRNVPGPTKNKVTPSPVKDSIPPTVDLQPFWLDSVYNIQDSGTITIGDQRVDNTKVNDTSEAQNTTSSTEVKLSTKTTTSPNSTSTPKFTVTGQDGLRWLDTIRTAPKPTEPSVWGFQTTTNDLFSSQNYPSSTIDTNSILFGTPPPYVDSILSLPGDTVSVFSKTSFSSPFAIDVVGGGSDVVARSATAGYSTKTTPKITNSKNVVLKDGVIVNHAEVKTTKPTTSTAKKDKLLNSPRTGTLNAEISFTRNEMSAQSGTQSVKDDNTQVKSKESVTKRRQKKTSYQKNVQITDKQNVGINEIKNRQIVLNDILENNDKVKGIAKISNDLNVSNRRVIKPVVSKATTNMSASNISAFATRGEKGVKTTTPGYTYTLASFTTRSPLSSSAARMVNSFAVGIKGIPVTLTPPTAGTNEQGIVESMHKFAPDIAFHENRLLTAQANRGLADSMVNSGTISGSGTKATGSIKSGSTYWSAVNSDETNNSDTKETNVANATKQEVQTDRVMKTEVRINSTSSANSSKNTTLKKKGTIDDFNEKTANISRKHNTTGASDDTDIKQQKGFDARPVMNNNFGTFDIRDQQPGFQVQKRQAALIDLAAQTAMIAQIQEMLKALAKFFESGVVKALTQAVTMKTSTNALTTTESSIPSTNTKSKSTPPTKENTDSTVSSKPAKVTKEVTKPATTITKLPAPSDKTTSASPSLPPQATVTGPSPFDTTQDQNSAQWLFNTDTYTSDSVQGSPTTGATKDYFNQRAGSSPLPTFPPVDTVPDRGAANLSPPSMPKATTSYNTQSTSRQTARIQTTGMTTKASSTPPDKSSLLYLSKLLIASPKKHDEERTSVSRSRVSVNPTRPSVTDVTMAQAMSSRPSTISLQPTMLSSALLGASHSRHSTSIRPTSTKMTSAPSSSRAPRPPPTPVTPPRTQGFDAPQQSLQPQVPPANSRLPSFSRGSTKEGTVLESANSGSAFDSTLGSPSSGALSAFGRSRGNSQLPAQLPVQPKSTQSGGSGDASMDSFLQSLTPQQKQQLVSFLSGKPAAPPVATTTTTTTTTTTPAPTTSKPQPQGPNNNQEFANMQQRMMQAIMGGGGGGGRRGGPPANPMQALFSQMMASGGGEGTGQSGQSGMGENMNARRQMMEMLAAGEGPMMSGEGPPRRQQQRNWQRGGGRGPGGPGGPRGPMGRRGGRGGPGGGRGGNRMMQRMMRQQMMRARGLDPPDLPERPGMGEGMGEMMMMGGLNPMMMMGMGGMGGMGGMEGLGGMGGMGGLGALLGGGEAGGLASMFGGGGGGDLAAMMGGGAGGPPGEGKPKGKPNPEAGSNTAQTEAPSGGGMFDMMGLGGGGMGGGLESLFGGGGGGMGNMFAAMMGADPADAPPMGGMGGMGGMAGLRRMGLKRKKRAVISSPPSPPNPATSVLDQAIGNTALPDIAPTQGISTPTQKSLGIQDTGMAIADQAQTSPTTSSPTKQTASESVVQMLLDFIAKNNINAAEVLKILQHVTSDNNKNVANTPPPPLPPTVAAQPSQVGYEAVIGQTVKPQNTQNSKQGISSSKDVVVDMLPIPNTFSANSNTWNTPARPLPTGTIGDVMGLSGSSVTTSQQQPPNTDFQSSVQSSTANSQLPLFGSANKAGRRKNNAMEAFMQANSGGLASGLDPVMGGTMDAGLGGSMTSSTGGFGEGFGGALGGGLSSLMSGGLASALGGGLGGGMPTGLGGDLANALTGGLGGGMPSGMGGGLGLGDGLAGAMAESLGTGMPSSMGGGLTGGLNGAMGGGLTGAMGGGLGAMGGALGGGMGQGMRSLAQMMGVKIPDTRKMSLLEKAALYRRYGLTHSIINDIMDVPGHMRRGRKFVTLPYEIEKKALQMLIIGRRTPDQVSDTLGDVVAAMTSPEGMRIRQAFMSQLQPQRTRRRG